CECLFYRSFSQPFRRQWCPNKIRERQIRRRHWPLLLVRKFLCLSYSIYYLLICAYLRNLREKKLPADLADSRRNIIPHNSKLIYSLFPILMMSANKPDAVTSAPAPAPLTMSG